MTDTAPSLPPESRRNRLIAIAMACAAVLFFTLIDTTAKSLTPRLGLVPTTWLRYMSALVLISAFLNPWRVPGLLQSRAPMLQAARALLLFGSTIANFIAIQYLQLAQTVSINFLAPLMVALLAGPFLGEWPGPRRLIAIAIGFIGVLIVARPGLGIIHPAALISIAGALCYAAVLLITRRLATRDDAGTTMFYSTAIGAIVLMPAAFWMWQGTIDRFDLLLIAICGLGASVGHWLLIQAQRLAPAPALAPFLYTQIVWMTLAGYLFFDQVPDRWTFIGGAVVIISGLYLLHRERIRRAPPSSAA